MKREDPAICADCGRTVEHGVALDLSGRCERCGESASIRPADRNPTGPDESPERSRESRRDDAVDRLRERYHEARALVAKEDAEPIHRGQLDWIFGVHGADDRRKAPLDARASELVVLWLEDLIRHLEELAGNDGDGGDLPAEEPGSTALHPSQRAARGLHAATREFADAFRRAADVACRP